LNIVEPLGLDRLANYVVCNKVPRKRRDKNVMEMSMDDEMTEDLPAKTTPVRVLPPAAQRALAEAEARRTAIDAASAAAPKEKGGRGGLEPGRYGDWEIKGLTSDF
jgi:hypothetical protein